MLLLTAHIYNTPQTEKKLRVCRYAEEKLKGSGKQFNFFFKTQFIASKVRAPSCPPKKPTLPTSLQFPLNVFLIAKTRCSLTFLAFGKCYKCELLEKAYHQFTRLYRFESHRDNSHIWLWNAGLLRLNTHTLISLILICVCFNYQCWRWRSFTAIFQDSCANKINARHLFLIFVYGASLNIKKNIFTCLH